MPTPTNGFVGNRAGISGAGKGVTTLQTTSTGTTCAIGMTGTASNEFVRVKFSGFRILGSTSGVAAIGICMNGVDGFAFEHVRFEGLTEGIEASDDIYISLIECEWYRINYAVNAFYGSSSHPNAWTFIDPYIEGAATYGLIFQNPTDLNILGGDYENNPGVSIYINGNPLEGTMGLNLSGGYFSLNSSPADVEISDGGSSINGVHTINGNEFQRISSSTFVTNNILLANTGSGVTTLNIRGNGFQGFNSYSPSSSRLYVTESNPGTNDYVIDSGGNWFQSSLETPAGAIWKETPWTAYTPTLGCGTGSLTTASATGSYKRLTPKTYAVEIVATVTTIGSCASYLTATLPTTANSAGVGNFRNTTTDYSGSIAVAAASSITTWFTSTGAIPVASGQVVEGSLVYESQ
jgi:hypothetical protein